MPPLWLEQLRRIQALAQTGLQYGRDAFDLERYTAILGSVDALVAVLGELAPDAAREVFVRETGYATPKIDVRGAAFDAGRILLVRERADGLWTLPGGWADVGESPAEAVAKEVREESGLEVRVAKLAALWDRDRQGHPPNPHHVYKVFFLCDVVGGAAAAGPETSDVGFFAPDALPPLSLGRVTPAQIRRMFEHHEDPSLPTDFE
ncbi:MAG TPA: NUDIX hydrolase [Longimicrobiales bacterium]|nr:NUDIX hydrolase [Longimicrobiales bacterium]